MELLKKIKMYTLMVSLLYVIMGLIMLLNPQFIIDAVNYIVGVFILLFGVIYLIRFIGKKDFNSLSKFNLLAGLLCIGFGIYILVNPTLLSSIIPFACGMLLLVDGLSKLKEAFEFKKYDYTRWWIALIIALIFIGFGIFMIFKAFAVSKVIIQIIGGILIIDALSDIWSYFCYKKYTPKKDKNLELENVKEAKIVEVKEEK